MNRNGRRPRNFQPQAESCESRLLLSTASGSGVLVLPGGESHPVRPNTPVLPFGAASNATTFIDPTVGIIHGERISLGARIFVAPFTAVDATKGAIRIGQNSAILDNVDLIANPSRATGSPEISIGEQVLVSYGATITGPSQIGGFGLNNAPTAIATNAVINSATIQPGSIVGTGAHVVGVTIPSGFYVLAHATITTQAEASNPALGKVRKVTASELSNITGIIANNAALAAGYTALYQGQSATGLSGSPVANSSNTTLFNGNLATVRGTGLEAGTANVSFEPSRRGPRFPIPGTNRTFEGNFAGFPARITGGVIFGQTAKQLQRNIGKHVSIRGDEGQPITIGSIAKLGQNVTIHAPRGGNLTIGKSFRAGSNSVILGGMGSTIGDNVTVGSSAVLENSKIGAGASIGDGSYISGSTIAAGKVIPAGSVIINGVTIV